MADDPSFQIPFTRPKNGKIFPHTRWILESYGRGNLRRGSAGRGKDFFWEKRFKILMLPKNA